VISLLVTGKFGLGGYDCLCGGPHEDRALLFSRARLGNHPLGKMNYFGAWPISVSRKPTGEADFFVHVCASVNRFSELFGVPEAFGVDCHSYFPASP
jgi:hypothetical protein